MSAFDPEAILQIAQQINNTIKALPIDVSRNSKFHHFLTYSSYAVKGLGWVTWVYGGTVGWLTNLAHQLMPTTLHYTSQALNYTAENVNLTALG